MHRMLFHALVPLAVLAACSPEAAENNAAPAAADADAVMDEIRAAENRQIDALNDGDLDDATAIYAADATLYEPRQSAATGPAIRAAFQRLMGDVNNVIEVDEDSQRHWVAASGDVAATSFTGTWTHTGPDGATITEPLVNHTVWQKQADGSWKIVSDLNATFAPPPTTAEAPDARRMSAAEPAADSAG